MCIIISDFQTVTKLISKYPPVPLHQFIMSQLQLLQNKGNGKHYTAKYKTSVLQVYLKAKQHTGYLHKCFGYQVNHLY
jgi:hypothetical protein